MPSDDTDILGIRPSDPASMPTQDLPTGDRNIPSQITAPAATGSIPSGAIQVAGAPVTVTISPPSSSPSPTSSSSTTSSTTPSATPTAAAKTGLSPSTTKAIAIAVPIAAILLLIPIIYLLYRSHKIRQEEEKRAGQRESREAMLVKESVEPKTNGPPPPRPQRPPSDAKDSRSSRPTNSIGLFNFDFGSPTSPQSPPRLSIARSLHLRRSQASALSPDTKSPQTGPNEARDPLPNNPNPGSGTAQPPPPYPNPVVPPESHFAPLNMIGTAVSQPSRPRPGRNQSGGGSAPQSNFKPNDAPLPPLPTNDSDPALAPAPAPGPAPIVKTNRNVNPPVSAYSTSDYHDSLQIPAAAAAATTTNRQKSQRESRPVSPLNSPSSAYHIPSFGLGMGGRFTLTDYYGTGSNRASSVGTATGGDAPMPPLPNQGAAGHSQSGPATTGSNVPSSLTPGLGANQLRPNISERRSDVSGLSIDPNWLSQEERERRTMGRRSGPEDDGYVSPVESNDSPGGNSKNDL